MLEDLGICPRSKHSEALVQSDTEGEGLNKRSSGNDQSLSGKFWSSELDDALNNLKQLETQQKVEALFKTIERSKPGLMETVRANEELQRILERETLAEKVKGLLKEKPNEIIDCGFGRAFEERGKAQMDETARRLKMIELAPLFWNALDR